MSATLEEMARILFKAWFVDFEPVRANMENRPSESASAKIAKLFPSELENGIPKGWRIGTFGEIAFDHRGKVNPRETDQNTAYVGLEHIPRKSLALDEWSTANNADSAKSQFQTGDILFGKLRPYFHKVVVAPIDGICSTDILVLRPRAPEFFGQLAVQASSDEIIRYADRLSNGAKMPRVNWADLSKFEIIVPSEQISQKYSMFVSSIVDKIRSNIRESKTLQDIRNSLLPRLLSGKISIKDSPTLE